MSVPQFGDAESSLIYRDRPAAFGILERAGMIALVRVSKLGHAPWLDLPGGALEPGEDDGEAMVREFGEETGLAVAAGALLCRADQLFINTDGVPYNNRGAFLEATFEADAADLKIEADHALVWLDPVAAVKELRHDAHAWATSAWLRRRG